MEMETKTKTKMKMEMKTKMKTKMKITDEACRAGRPQPLFDKAPPGPVTWCP